MSMCDEDLAKIHKASDLLDEAQGLVDDVHGNAETNYGNISTESRKGERGRELWGQLAILEQVSDQIDEVVNSLGVCE